MLRPRITSRSIAHRYLIGLAALTSLAACGTPATIDDSAAAPVGSSAETETTSSTSSTTTATTDAADAAETTDAADTTEADVVPTAT